MVLSFAFPRARPFILFRYPLGSDVLSYTMETNDKWHGRKLLQEVEENATEIPEDDEHQYIKNCTEPGRNELFPLLLRSLLHK